MCLKNNMYSILFNILNCDLVLIKTLYCLILIIESSFHIQSSKLSQIHVNIFTNYMFNDIYRLIYQYPCFDHKHTWMHIGLHNLVIVKLWQF
jgi:hypothetical protein